MKKALTLITLIALAVMLLVPAALADTTITVCGTGVVRVTPDMAVITLGVQKTGPDISAIQDEANAVIGDILDALRSEEGGVAEEDIRTDTFSLTVDYSREYAEKDPVNYRAYVRLRVIVRDIDRAGRVIDLAFAHGANVLDGVRFDIADSTACAEAALAAAVRDGAHRAGIIAEAAGLTLPAAPAQISEGALGETYQNMSYRTSDTAEGVAAAATSVMGGTVDVTATVTMTYVIAD